MSPILVPSALVVDDHPLVARGIADYLRTHCAIARADPVCRPDEVWALIAADGAPDLALVDFWLPDGTALPLIARLHELHPTTRVLVISGDADPAVRAKVRGLSVDGFLLKQAEPAVFALAVATVLRGGRWFEDGPVVGATPESERALPVSAADLGLTPRQGQVLALMLRGLPNKRVARQLGLSESTVKEHVSGILERLGARNRIELITRLRGRRIDG